IRYLRAVARIWGYIPPGLRYFPVFSRYGAHLHSLVLKFEDRRQNHSTSFFRNRAELELIRRLADRANPTSGINIAVFACSKGAEVYSLASVLKEARQDQSINIRAIDLSEEIVEFAKQGVYSFHDGADSSDATESADNTHRDQPVGF